MAGEWGACMAGGLGMHGRGGMHGGGMHGRGCAWQGQTCMAGGVCGMHACPPPPDTTRYGQ